MTRLARTIPLCLLSGLAAMSCPIGSASSQQQPPPHVFENRLAPAMPSEQALEAIRAKAEAGPKAQRPQLPQRSAAGQVDTRANPGGDRAPAPKTP